MASYSRKAALMRISFRELNDDMMIIIKNKYIINIFNFEINTPRYIGAKRAKLIEWTHCESVSSLSVSLLSLLTNLF